MKEITNPTGALIQYFFITLFVTFIGLLIGARLPISVIYVINRLFSLFLILSVILSLFIRRPRDGGYRRGFSMIGVFIYSLIFGIILYPTMIYYTGLLGASVVIYTFLATLIIVGILGLFSIKKGTDKILSLGPILFISTIILMVVYLILSILGVSQVHILITIISTALFSLWIVYDIYRFKRYSHYIRTKNDLAPYVLDIYIDFINLFLDLLRIVGSVSSRDS